MSKDSLSLWQRLKKIFINPQTDPSNNSGLEGFEKKVDKIEDLAHTDDRTSKANIANPYLANQSQKPKAHTALLAQSPGMNAAFEDDSSFEDATDDTFIDSTDSKISSQQLEQLLTAMGYHFLYHPANKDDEQSVHHYTMHVSDKEHQWGCMIRFFSEQQLIAVYSILPTPVPDAYRPNMLAVISYLNYDLMIGNLELDAVDGELRFKTSLDLEVTGANELVLSYLIQSNFSLFSRLYDTLDEILHKSNPANDLKTAMDDLIFAQQSNHYLLVTDTQQ